MKAELPILDLIHTIHSPVLDGLFRGITHLGDAGIIWILLTVILVVIPKTRSFGFVLALALAYDLILCNFILKPLIARPRPFVVNPAIDILIKAPPDHSFPSGHTAASFSVLFAFIFSKIKKWWIPVLILSLLMAFSRLYLYVHYPTDILGGIVIGCICGFLGVYTSKFFLKK